MRAIPGPVLALVAALALLGEAPAAPSQEGDGRVEELLSEVRARGSGVEPKVLEELGSLQNREALEALEKATLLMKGPLKVFAAHRAFRHFASDPGLGHDAAEFLVERAGQPREDFARNAAFCLGALLPHAVDALATVVEQNEDGDCRALALMHLVDAGLPLDDTRLERWSRARDELVRYEALRAFAARIEDVPERAGRIARLEHSSDRVDRMVACQLLTDLAPADAAPRLGLRLLDEDPRVRRKALACLASVPPALAIPELVGALEGAPPELAARIASLLGRLSGVHLGTDAQRWRDWWSKEAARFQPPKAGKAGSGAAEDLPRTRASFYGLPVDSERVVFAIDASDSMQHAVPGGSDESRIDAAKRQLGEAITNLDDDARFDLVHFGGDARSWQGQLVRVDRGVRKRALKHIDSLELSFGTDVYGGLHEAFRDPDVDTILLLTDGDPYLGAVDDKTALRRVVRQWNTTRQVTIHCIAIGQERTWLRKLAEESGGRYVCLK